MAFEGRAAPIVSLAILWKLTVMCGLWSLCPWQQDPRHAVRARVIIRALK